MEKIDIETFNNSIYPHSIDFGIIKERPFVDFTLKHSIEMSMELYGDSVSKGDVVLIFKSSNVNFLNRSRRKPNPVESSILSFQNHEKFNEGLEKLIQNKCVDKIKEFPSASIKDNTLHECLFCDSNADIDISIEIKRSVPLKKNRKSYESVGISHTLPLHKDCARKFVDIDIESSPVMKEIISDKI